MWGEQAKETVLCVTKAEKSSIFGLLTPPPVPSTHEQSENDETTVDDIFTYFILSTNSNSKKKKKPAAEKKKENELGLFVCRCIWIYEYLSRPFGTLQPYQDQRY